MLIAAGALTRIHGDRETGSLSDTAAPPAVSAPSPAGKQVAALQAAPAFDAPAFDIVRVNPQGDAVVAGRAAPHSDVTVFDGADPIGTVTADGQGEWVLLPERPLAPGSRELSLTARDPQAARDVASEDVVLLLVPVPGGGAGSGQPASPGSGVLAVEVPRDGGGPATVLQVPSAGSASDEPGPVPSGGVTVDVVDYTADGAVSIGGRAQPGTSVQVYVDNVLVGRSDADAEGQWRIRPDRGVEPGRYTLRADQVTGQGRVTARAEIPFQMSDTQDGPSNGKAVVVQPGNSLWRIARRTYGEGLRYTVIYQANESQIQDPDLIYPGQIFSLPIVGAVN
ncbi:MAG TPA: LysM peptidoglycan-binding domain-containing protein [Arenibaculum sp.]|nr:LysM peptidoglycan-binding domain-containing protein [Arenibaculum sp.]